MRALIHSWLFGRVTVYPACFADQRPQCEIDAELQRRFDAAVREKELQRIPRVKADPDFIPEHLRARQAA